MVKPLSPSDPAKVKIMKGVALIVLGVAAVYAMKAFIEFLESRMEGFEGKAVTVTYYFMEGCPHCKAMKPEWEKFKELAAKSSGKVLTKEFSADVDSSEIGKAVPKVSGFPTIHLSVQGKTTEYKGERNAKGLMESAQKMLA